MSQSDTKLQLSRSSSRRRVWLVFKWLLFAAVLWFVGQRAYELWSKDELHQVQLGIGWLMLAGLMYAVGWLPSVWFWQKLMQSLGGEVGFRDTARAYYCGHLGKYIPGKAMVLVIRASFVKERGLGSAAAAVTAAYETLLMMGAGAAIALALSPLTGWPAWIGRFTTARFLPAVVVLVAITLSLPLLSRFLTFFALRMTPRDRSDSGQTVKIGTKLVAAGLCAFVVSWAFLGLSLGLTLRAVSGEAFHLADWPIWTGGVTIATVIGFVAIFAPGGVGVREGLLIEVLSIQPSIGEKHAVVAAVLLRLVWLAGEIIAAAALYYLAKPRRADSRRSPHGPLAEG